MYCFHFWLFLNSREVKIFYSVVCFLSKSQKISLRKSHVSPWTCINSLLSLPWWGTPLLLGEEDDTFSLTVLFWLPLVKTLFENRDTCAFVFIGTSCKRSSVCVCCGALQIPSYPPPASVSRKFEWGKKVRKTALHPPCRLEGRISKRCLFHTCTDTGMDWWLSGFFASSVSGKWTLHLGKA